MKEHRTLGKQLVWFCMAGLMVFALPLMGEQVTGFVTQVGSPTEFSVGSLRVLVNARTRCATQELSSDILLTHRGFFLFPHYSYQLRSLPVPQSELAVPCDAVPLRVGSRVQIAGDRGPQEGPFTATHLTIYKVGIQRKIAGPIGARGYSFDPAKWAGVALLEENPQVSRSAQGWAGSLWLDGYPMSIAYDTQLLPWPDLQHTELGSFFDWAVDLYDDSIVTSPPPASAFPPSRFEANNWAGYQGPKDSEGSVPLSRIALWPNQAYAGCQKIYAGLTGTIQPPDYANHIAGQAVLPRYNAIPFDFSRRALSNKIIPILPNRTVQDYVSRIGMSLVPSYQQLMPDTSPTKIHFRFYVVQTVEPAFYEEVANVSALPWNLSRPSWDDAVLPLPDGVILIPTRTLKGLKTDGELAAILSGAIAAVLQKQSCIAKFEGSRFAGTGDGEGGAISIAMDWAAFWPGFVLWRDEQAIRIGIRQMYLAGYDIREAPFARAAALGQSAANPIRNASGSAAMIPWYTAYAFHYISQFYSSVDYSKLKRGEAEYAQFLKELRQADPEAFDEGGK